LIFISCQFFFLFLTMIIFYYCYFLSHSMVAACMSNHIQYLAHDIAAANGLDAAEFIGVSVPSLTGVLTYGRIISNSMDGRLNAASVMLEGDDSLSRGCRVRLDLTNIESFALFPGQVCVIQGRNDTGQVLVVQQMYTNAHPHAAGSLVEQMQQARPLTIMYAAGPFHLCPLASAAIAEAAQPDELDFTAFLDLIEHAQRCSPDVLILSGPFIDADSDIVRCGGANTENVCLRSGRDDELLASLLVHVRAKLSGTKSRVRVFIVSDDDDDDDDDYSSSSYSLFSLLIIMYYCLAGGDCAEYARFGIASRLPSTSAARRSGAQPGLYTGAESVHVARQQLCHWRVRRGCHVRPVHEFVHQECQGSCDARLRV
jgi:hypothetical protein